MNGVSLCDLGQNSDSLDLTAFNNHIQRSANIQTEEAAMPEQSGCQCSCGVQVKMEGSGMKSLATWAPWRRFWFAVYQTEMGGRHQALASSVRFGEWNRLPSLSASDWREHNHVSETLSENIHWPKSSTPLGMLRSSPMVMPSAARLDKPTTAG